MPSFSQASLDKLSTCHEDLQKVMLEAIKHFDFTITYGVRTVAQQQALYAQGRTAPGSIVTWVDGVKKKSNHNYIPSRAVDVAPWPIDWKDRESFIYLAGYIMAIAEIMYADGRIKHKIRWGGDFSMNDRTIDEKKADAPHFEIID
jgi:peptidoglycan LD-endopeptidase CwlK